MPQNVHRREFIRASAGVAGAITVAGLPGAARAASWAIIDAQVHAYERNHPGRPKHPDRFCLVKPVDPNDPAVADGIADWKAKKGTVGIRILMNDNVSTDPADPAINRVLAAAAKQSLAVNLLCSGRLYQAGQLAARNPNTRIVIDHLGLQQPLEPSPPAQPWAELPKVLALATYPNVVLKITGAYTLSHEPFPYRDSGTRFAATLTPMAWTAACGGPIGPVRSNC